MARLFPGLPAPTDCHITDWLGEEYSRGCYAALFGPGDWAVLGPHLRSPHGRVRWAGTETSTEYFGLMEGAIRSGHRVAAGILSGPPEESRAIPTATKTEPLRRLRGRDE
jgi:monoamine oxidase